MEERADRRCEGTEGRTDERAKGATREKNKIDNCGNKFVSVLSLILRTQTRLLKPESLDRKPQSQT